MKWLIEWESLSARIKGILDAGIFFYKALHHSSEDARSVKKKILLKEAEKIFSNLKAFVENNESALPDNANVCINSFLIKPEFSNSNFFSPKKNWESANVQFVLTSLATFRAEFDYIIADTQLKARRITERAFIHLQRCIVVDENFRDKWIEAFENNEIACEKLGALHLLLHGVWAFKANAAGGRTDLILNEPLNEVSDVEKAAVTLVLTEWKRVTSEKELGDKIKEAQKQAEIYNSDILGGIELRNYCYLVMVSGKMMKMPDDKVVDNTIYRIINIATNPESPSIEAKK